MELEEHRLGTSKTVGIYLDNGLWWFWGCSYRYFSSNIATNPIKEEIRNGLKLEITDNLALSGYNVPLCLFNFISSLVLFIMGSFSFYRICKDNGKDDKSERPIEVIKFSFVKKKSESYDWS